MLDFPIVSINIILPLIGALFIMLFVSQSTSIHQTLFAKYVAVMSSIFSIIASTALFVSFDSKEMNMQFVEKSIWASSIGLEYHVGIDSISLMFIMLTSLLTFICILISLFSITNKVKEYLACFLLLESLVIGFFSSMNLLLFYLFFEAMLIPLFLIIGIWGGENRIYSSLKFFLYTFFGSLLLFASLIMIYNLASTFDIEKLPSIIHNIDPSLSKILFLGSFVAFAIKVPMWPLHTWLPDAHVQAPTGGSIMLAGVLLKVGGYAIIRVSISLFPEASVYFSDFIMLISAVAVVYGSFLAIAQTDMKKMIAYSSIAHMGFVTAGIFSFTSNGIRGAIFQMISHGVISSGLFLSTGMLYERHHTKEISKYGGVASKMPIFASFFMVYLLGSIALPGTSGFIGEFFTLVGVFYTSPIAMIFLSLSMVLGAVYMLSLYRSLMFGEITSKSINKFKDLASYEIIVSIPLVILVIYFGIYPNSILQLLDFPVQYLGNIITLYDKAIL